MASPPDGYLGFKGFDTNQTKAVEQVLVAVTNGGAGIYPVSVVGGERNTTSSTNNYDVTKHECNSTVLSAGTGAKNIGASGTTPIYLMGVYISAALVGTLTITGFYAEDGTTPASLVIPIGASGWVLAPGDARRCEAGCTMTKSSASDDTKILVDWRPIT